MNPFDYSLCDRTVTVYRKTGDTVTRQQVTAYLSAKTVTSTETCGKSLEKLFRLIIPGDFPLSPGDRVYGGIGPECVDWRSFLPAQVEELYEVSFAKPCYWEGQVTHWEAGNRKEHV